MRERWVPLRHAVEKYPLDPLIADARICPIGQKFAGHSLLEAIQMWHNSTRAYRDDGFHMAITWLGEDVWREMEPIVKNNGATKEKRFEVGDFTKQTFLGRPTNVCLESFVFAEFFPKTGRPLLETLLRIPNGTGDLKDHLSMLSIAAKAVSAEREPTASRKAERTGIPASGV